MTGILGWLRSIPMLLVMGGIFYLSSQTGDSLSPYMPVFPGADKIAHGAAYGLLAASALFALSEKFRREKPKQAAVMAVLVCALYGISDEFHQSFVPERSVEALDVLADSVGGVVVAVIWYRYLRR